MKVNNVYQYIFVFFLLSLYTVIGFKAYSAPIAPQMVLLNAIYLYYDKSSISLGLSRLRNSC